MKLIYKQYSISIFNDETFTPASRDNVHNYERTYPASDREYQASCWYGIQVYEGAVLLTSCLLTGYGGATGIYENSLVIDNDCIIICCGDSVFCLAIPTLDMLWCTPADDITCFQVFKLDGEYIIHGECEISRIDAEGKTKWQFGGENIFVAMGDERGIQIFSDHIVLRDFGGRTYKIDFMGEMLPLTQG